MLQIAKILKSNGTDGGVLMGFREYGPEDIDRKEPVYIEFDGLPVPFFVDDIQRKGNDKAVAHLTDIKTFDDAEELVGRAVYVDYEFEEEEDGEMTLEGFVGWTLLNRGKAVGPVVDIEDIPGNPCLYVESDGGQSMIPLHEDFVLSLDPVARVLDLDLPDGLI